MVDITLERLPKMTYILFFASRKRWGHASFIFPPFLSKLFLFAFVSTATKVCCSSASNRVALFVIYLFVWGRLNTLHFTLRTLQIACCLLFCSVRIRRIRTCKSNHCFFFLLPLNHYTTLLAFALMQNKPTFCPREDGSVNLPLEKNTEEGSLLLILVFLCGTIDNRTIYNFLRASSGITHAHIHLFISPSFFSKHCVRSTFFFCELVKSISPPISSNSYP